MDPFQATWGQPPLCGDLLSGPDLLRFARLEQPARPQIMLREIAAFRPLRMAHLLRMAVQCEVFQAVQFDVDTTKLYDL